MYEPRRSARSNQYPAPPRTGSKNLGVIGEPAGVRSPPRTPVSAAGTDAEALRSPSSVPDLESRLLGVSSAQPCGLGPILNYWGSQLQGLGKAGASGSILQMRKPRQSGELTKVRKDQVPPEEPCWQEGCHLRGAWWTHYLPVSCQHGSGREPTITAPTSALGSDLAGESSLPAPGGQGTGFCSCLCPRVEAQ